MSSDQQPENLFVRVKIDEEFRFVTLNKNDIAVKSFLTAGRNYNFKMFLAKLKNEP